MLASAEVATSAVWLALEIAMVTLPVVELNDRSLALLATTTQFPPASAVTTFPLIEQMLVLAGSIEKLKEPDPEPPIALTVVVAGVEGSKVMTGLAAYSTKAA